MFFDEEGRRVPATYWGDLSVLVCVCVHTHAHVHSEGGEQMNVLTAARFTRTGGR